jgi:hypothetical protein
MVFAPQPYLLPHFCLRSAIEERGAGAGAEQEQEYERGRESWGGRERGRGGWEGERARAREFIRNVNSHDGGVLGIAQ